MAINTQKTLPAVKNQIKTVFIRDFLESEFNHYKSLWDNDYSRYLAAMTGYVAKCNRCETRYWQNCPQRCDCYKK